jgi:hypothetical protein
MASRLARLVRSVISRPSLPSSRADHFRWSSRQ